MMTKQQKIFFGISFGVFLAVMINSYFLPPIEITDDQMVNIDDRRVSGSPTHHWSVPILYTTKGLELSLPENIIYDFPDSCQLTIKRGMIFRNPIGVIIYFDEQEYHFSTNFLDRTLGGKLLMVSVIISFMISTFKIFLKKKINWPIVAFAEFVSFFFLAESILQIT